MSKKVAATKTAEGDALVEEADKLTTRTLFRWKLDWDGATMLYEKAGTCYKNAKQYTSAKEAFQKASRAFNECKIPFSAAKNMELAAAMAKEAKDDEEAAEKYQQAAGFYRENNSPDKAAECIVKAAKILEDTAPEKSVLLSKEACSVFETEERELFAAATFKYAITLMLKLFKYDDAIELLVRLTRIHTKLAQTHDLVKDYLSMVIVHLYRDDFVAAQRVLLDDIIGGGFGTQIEAKVASDLIEAFDKRDPQLLTKVQANQTLNFLDNQIIRMAKNLKIAGGGKNVSEVSSNSTNSNTTATNSSDATNNNNTSATKDGKEEEDSGLA